ncbi:hypothetical protein OV079_06130 [Nannocystis pusilla]|uniref:Lipoprotein n=1 Tax=Nannocystis pusilla TaxID=889268 RepID=A0A9X3IV90_9BACT|nr:hypothetical protein [Nannocystis pusilla]MCY1005156.1 hypothetical protein [Nannocystis pusilla]
MPRIIHRSLLLTVALLVPGCLRPAEVIGATITATDGEGTLSATTDDGQGASTTTVQDSTTGLPSGAYGSACSLKGFPPILNATAISPQPDCDGGICLLIIDEKYQCELDVDCQDLDPAAKCDEGLCDVSADVLLDETRCTQTCETVEDCPEIPGCMTGLICSVFLVSDELCCQKVCGCKDSLYVPGVMSLEMLCNEEPDWCG